MAIHFHVYFIYSFYLCNFAHFIPKYVESFKEFNAIEN